jgi:hypothetical protein
VVVVGVVVVITVAVGIVAVAGTGAGLGGVGDHGLADGGTSSNGEGELGKSGKAVHFIEYCCDYLVGTLAHIRKRACCQMQRFLIVRAYTKHKVNTRIYLLHTQFGRFCVIRRICLSGHGCEVQERPPL